MRQDVALPPRIPSTYLGHPTKYQPTDRFANLALHVATWKPPARCKPLQPARFPASSGMAFRDKAIRGGRRGGCRESRHPAARAVVA